MTRASSSMLSRLERIKQARGRDAASQKIELLKLLAGCTLANPRQVRRLHEVLCFLRAYPDDRRVLRAVETMLGGFADRADLARCHDALSDTGIAGTRIHASFYYATLRWLISKWPSCVHINWDGYRSPQRLAALLPLLMPAQDALTLEDSELSARDLVHFLKGPHETDACFLARRFEALDAAVPVREKLFEDLEVPMVLSPGMGTPSRSASKLPGTPVFYVPDAPHRDRDWRRMKPPGIRSLSPTQGERVVGLGRAQMITRGRDLFAFMNGNPRDVRLFHMGDGLQFACIGLNPGARYLIETMYVYLALQSGVPVGYMQAAALLRSAEINFNIFDSFRGAQARHVFRAFLAMLRHTLGCDAFIINSQQLGQGNAEALKTGAWWFYHGLGFRPRNTDVERIMKAELRHKARDPRYRSSTSTLRKLAADYLYLFAGRGRTHTVSSIQVDRIGLRISCYLAGRFGADREASFDICAHEAARLLGLRRPPRGSRAERDAWRNWAPLILLQPETSPG